MIEKMKASNPKISLHLPKWDISKNRVGIQIGEKSIKIVEMEKKKNLWETKQTILTEIPVGMVKEGKILQSELLGLKIKDLFSKHNINVKQVSVFIEELPFFMRHLQLPKMQKKERERAILYHTKLEIPVNPSDLTIRHSYIADVKESEQKEYSIIAVYSTFINKIVEVIHAAGLSIQTLSIEPDAIFAGLKHKKLIEKTEEPLMMVKLDSKRMLIAIYQHEKLVYSRYVTYPFDKKECAKEIQRTLISWNGKNQKNRIQKVLLIGGKNSWDESKQLLEQFLPITVRLITSPFTACLGIAIKDLDKNTLYTDKNINLANRLSTTSKIWIPTAIFILFVFSTVVIYPLLLQKEVNELKEKINAPHGVLELVQEEEQLLNQNKNLVTTKDSIEQKQVEILTLYKLISSLQPKGIHLTQWIFSENVIQLSGNGSSQVDVIQFFKGVQKQAAFHQVHLTQSNLSAEQVQFTIEIMRNKASEGIDSEKVK